MTAPQTSFDAATATLRPGVNLVEAGAGTGKTFAIAMLVLRFVTEFGFPLPQILVVTFTRAATEELRERIRARLASARELLIRRQKTEDRRQKTAPLSSDFRLLSSVWLPGLTERGISEELALQRLELALLDMDLAPVFTIHGFCQRMLQEQALESGQLFDFDLTTNVTNERNEVVCDYWRRTVYPLSPLHCALITQTFRTPAELAKSVEGASRKVARVEPRAVSVAEALADFDRCLDSLADWWRGHAHLLRPLLDEAVAAGLFKTELSTHLPDWWHQVDAFLAGNSQQLPAAFDFLKSQKILEQLNGHKFRTSGGLSGEAKKQAFIDSLPLPRQELADFNRARADIILALRVGLVKELADGLTRALHRKSLLCFDDLIAQLARSLAGAQGPELRRILGERYAVALIDEFQDTDDAQYAIFSGLFAGRSHYLYLIGDPKQAIYTFRGADIYSYFKARQQADIRLNLDRNYRSHPTLVEAVNRLFSRRKDAFASSDLPYHPVQPAKGAEDGRLVRRPETAQCRPSQGRQEGDQGEQNLAAMLYYALDDDPESKDGRWSSTRAAARIVSFIVTEITRLLDGERATMLQTADQPPRPLAASDIAILVRSHKQGETFQVALARTGIPAVMASRQSVFAAVECDQLFLLLQALAAPGDTSLVKAALTLPWFGMDGAEWYALWQDPARADERLNRFYDYHQLWREQGLPVMMSRVLENENILLHLARLPLAERRISNIHHLLELIQAAAAEEAMGPDKTLQWLQVMRTTAKTAPHSLEETELRLESDEEAVTIVTMHGAKGLEYPVVFCPFLWQRGNFLKTAKDCVISHDADKALVMDLGSPDFEARREQALREELAEELRLAYVALTRARCRCYAFWANVRGSAASRDSRDSALAWLLSLEGGGHFSERATDLQTADGAVIFELMAAHSDAPLRLTKEERQAEELSPASFTGRSLHTDWMLHSYSSLTADRADRPEEREAADLPETAETSDASPPAADLLPDLPKGAALGNVVHALLETIPFSILAENNGEHEAEIRKQCAWFGVEVEPGKLAALLQKVVRTPLAANAASFTLADLNYDETIREMPFYLRLQPQARDGQVSRAPGMDEARPQARDGQVSRAPGMAQERPGSTDQINTILAGLPAVTPVSSRVLQGYLTGFIDLVCCYQGKYYIIDYKSNYLGDRLADYEGQGWPSVARAKDGGRVTAGQGRLAQAMAEHNYGLQYWIYTLMLHRYLRMSLEDYDYATHFGGVMYLFVRGMEPTQPGSGVYYDLPDPAILTRLDRCLCQKSEDRGQRTDGLAFGF